MTSVTMQVYKLFRTWYLSKVISNVSY